MAAEHTLTKVKHCSGMLAPKEWQTVQAALAGAADALWETGGGVVTNGGVKAENVVKVLAMLAAGGGGGERTAAALQFQQLQEIVRAVQKWMTAPKCSGRAATLACHFLMLWGTGVCQEHVAALETLTTAASGHPAANEAFAMLLLNLGKTDHLRAGAPYAIQWLKAAQGNTAHHTASLCHVAWTMLLEMHHATSSPCEALSEPVHESMTRIVATSLGGVSFKKNIWVDTDGSKCDPNGGEGSLTVLCTPTSNSYSFTDEQTLHGWVFATLPSLIHEGLAEDALTYAMRILYQLAGYAGRGEYHVAFSTTPHLSLPFVEVCIIHLVDLLTALVQLLPAAYAQIEGEVLGLFFQILSQERRAHHHALPPPRGHAPVSGWMGEDSVTRSCVAVAGVRGVDAPPSAWLNTHVPHALQMDAAGETVSTADDTRAGREDKGEPPPPRAPIWKGEVFVAMLEWFAATDSQAEGAAVEAFFTTPHWMYYPHTHTFAPTVFKYIMAHAGRPALRGVENVVYLHLLHLTALSPHSLWGSMVKLLPAVLNRVSYLDVFHRILDLPLLSHFLSIPRLVERGAQLAQFLAEWSEKAGDDAPLFADLAGSLLFYTFPPSGNPDAPGGGLRGAAAQQGLAEEDAVYCQFWAEHKHAIVRWVAEMEPLPLCKKATTCAVYIPALLRKYLDVMSVEYARDPKMAANIVTACLARYHMLSLPPSVAREVRSILLDEVFKCVTHAPTILQLTVEDMTACLRQKHVPTPAHRCLRLTANAAASFAQMFHHVLSPQKPKSSAAVESAKQVFAEAHCCLFDIIALLYQRSESCAPGELYRAGSTPLHAAAAHTSSSDVGSALPTHAENAKYNEPRRPRGGDAAAAAAAPPPVMLLHEALEATYTVWDAVEAVDALCVTLCTMAVLHPPLLDTARASLNAVVRAVAKQALPEGLLPATLCLHQWLEHPAVAYAAVFKPLPPTAASPLAFVDAATIPSGFPKVGLWPLPS